MRQNTFGIPLISSCVIHLALLLAASQTFHQANLRPQDLFPIALVDVTPPPSTSMPQTATPEEAKVPPPKKLAQAVPARRDESAKPEPPPAPTSTVRVESRAPDAKPAAASSEAITTPAATARAEGGGSEAGAGNSSSKGDVAVAAGSGAGGGGGTAIAGLGRGAGAPGLPALFAPLRTNREAKPLQTARASYPPMALRAGIEADVTLRIEVDPQGAVTKAEILKSGGAGFDDEALRAVKQSRFEPAQRDGQSVPAEFTYIYKFRLQR